MHRALFGDMLRFARPDGVVIDMPAPPAPRAIVADRPEEIRSRRVALDPRLDGPARLGLAAYRAAAEIYPRLRLMLALEQPAGPPDWADIGLLPPSGDAGQIGGAGRRLAGGRLAAARRRLAAWPSPCRPSRSNRSRRCGRPSARARRRSRCARDAGAAALRRRFGRLFRRHLSLSALRRCRPPPPNGCWSSIGQFCFGYPFVMAWYWIAGGLHLLLHARTAHGRRPIEPPLLEHPPPISILVPCYNEGDNAEETLETAASVDYPEFEIIAINDGSRDNTAEVLDRLAARIPNLRVVHLAANQGKATAHECRRAAGPDTSCWSASTATRCSIRRRCTGSPAASADAHVGGHGRQSAHPQPHLVAGPPAGRRIFLDHRADPARADDLRPHVHCVRGVICAFRKRALQDAGWWSPRTITDDIDVTWRVQWRAGG